MIYIMYILTEHSAIRTCIPTHTYIHKALRAKTIFQKPMHQNSRNNIDHLI